MWKGFFAKNQPSIFASLFGEGNGLIKSIILLYCCSIFALLSVMFSKLAFLTQNTKKGLSMEYSVLTRFA